MKKSHCFLGVVAVIVCIAVLPAHAYAQEWTVGLDFAKDLVFKTSLEFGIHPDGTDGIDPGLGESELPPKPPAGVFDVRFTGSELGNGVQKDIRGNSLDQWEWIIDIQREAGGDIAISWETLPSGEFWLQDMFDGIVFNIDMTQQNSFTINNVAIVQVNIKYKQYILGDCNKNGRIDIGDAVILINYLLELGPAPDPIGRGDCNQNGRLDIGDVVMIINNLLYGTPIDSQMLAKNISGVSVHKPVIDTPGTMALASLNQVESTSKDISLDVETDVAIAGVFAKIGYDSDQLSIGTPALSQRSENMKLEYNVTDSGMNIVIYSIEGKRIEPGNGSLLSIPIQPKEGINHIDAVGLTIDDISLSDIEGRLIPVEGLNISTSIDSYDRNASLNMEFQLKQNYPNPFNPDTIVEFMIPSAHNNAYVELHIYNLQGQLIRTLINTTMFAGFHTVVWDGTDMSGIEVSGGMYLYQLKVNDFVETKKMLFMK